MFTHKRLVVAVAAALSACAAQPTSSPDKAPAFGAPVSAAEIARWDISIPPSGEGLPAGSGSAKQGEAVYVAQCQACHGPKGAGTPADPLVGGSGTLATGKPLRTVGSYWPYATTLFDYTRRAMPLNKPLSLSDNEVYAVTAYVLYLNGIVGENAEMNAKTLPQVKMPNRDGFIDMSRK